MLTVKKTDGKRNEALIGNKSIGKSFGVEFEEEYVSIFVGYGDEEDIPHLKKEFKKPFNKVLKSKYLKVEIELFKDFILDDSILKKNLITYSLIDTIKVVLENNEARIEYITATPDMAIQDWNLKWSLNLCYYKLKEICINNKKNFSVNADDNGAFNDAKLTIGFSCPSDNSIIEEINRSYGVLSKIGEEVERQLKHDFWNPDFHTNEKLFSTELILPLLRKMGFIDVVYNHGKKEYGKDFTFSEVDRFGRMINYGLQVKAGDMSGKVNSPIEEILGQLEDAFCMPYYSLTSKEPKYISSLIIAIRGRFTENAKEKIMKKIHNRFGRLMGAIYFLDKDKILELANKYY